jgi:hypothetical protein
MKWRIAAVAFVLINAGGAAYAVSMGEWEHAAVHFGLLIGGYLMWPLVPGSRRDEPPQADVADERLNYQQQSVDAVALEVERFGEAQRYSEKLRAERAASVTPERDKTEGR